MEVSAAEDRGWMLVLQGSGRVVRSVVDDLITMLVPAGCRICGGPLLSAGTVPVCSECMGSIRGQTGALCRVCGEALGMESDRFAGQYGAEGLLCTPCRTVPPEFDRAVAGSVYAGQVREMLHLLKYEGVASIAGLLGQTLAGGLEALEELTANEDVLVVAVPLYRSKRRQRRFNQAELLADAAVLAMRRRRLGLRLRTAHDVLERTRETASQYGLTPHGRRRNLRGAFEVRNAEAVRGLTVLLIDDIYTTGATARECARVLRRSGAAKVLVATLSRAQPEMVALWDNGDNSADWDAG